MVQTQIEENSVNVLQPENSFALKKTRTATTRLLGNTAIAFITREVASNVMLHCLERWLESGTLIYAVVKRKLFMSFFIWPEVRFTWLYLNGTIDKRLLTQFYDDTGNFYKK